MTPNVRLITESKVRSEIEPKPGLVTESEAGLATELGAKPIIELEVGPVGTKKSLIPIIIYHNH